MKIDDNNTEAELPSFDDFISPSYDDWKKSAVDSLKGASFEKTLFSIADGIEIQPYYNKENIAELNLSKEAYSFARGITYDSSDEIPQKVSSWRIGQRYSVKSAESLIEFLKTDLVNGLDEIHIPVNIPDASGVSFYGYNREFIKNGISLESFSKLAPLFKESKIPDFPVYGDFMSNSFKALSLLKKIADNNNCDFSKISGFAGGSPLSQIALLGRLPGTIENAFDEIVKSVDAFGVKAPELKTVVVNSSFYQFSGAWPVNEVAIAMLEVSAYLRELIKRGITPDHAAGSICINSAQGTNFFLEIAKLRAFRILFAGIASKFGASGDSLNLYIYSETSPVNFSIRNPHVNILRSITATLAAAAGGAGTIHTAPYDEFAKGETSPFSSRIARNIQLVARDEFSAGSVEDPYGGSYYLETLTNEIAKKAWDVFQKIDSDSGFVEAFKNGTIKKLVTSDFASGVKDAAKRKKKLVGVNDYVYCGKTSIEVENTFKNEIKSSDKDSESIGFQTAPLNMTRLPGMFEELQELVARLQNVSSEPLDIMILEIGNSDKLRFRTAFVKSFLGSAGFDFIVENYSDVTAFKNNFVSKNIDLIVVSSLDTLYSEIVTELGPFMDSAVPDAIRAIAGRPLDNLNIFEENGFKTFLYLGADAVEVLTKIAESIGKRKEV
ncbi:MAG: hypothetical protein JXR91_07130 [Deltaproteobacteria bacterium]|nr:hypothetical protein [Deltaproteobacteria bacterium]